MKFALMMMLAWATIMPMEAQNDSVPSKKELLKQRIREDVEAIKNAPTTQARKDSIDRIIQSKIENNTKLTDKQKERLLKNYALVQKIDTKMSNSYHSTKKYDTLYLRRPDQMFTLTTKTNIGGLGIDLKGDIEGISYRSRTTSDLSFTTAFNISYQGIGAGFSLNPMKWAGKNKDFEINVNSYSNQWGVDVIYQDAKTLNGYFQYNGKRCELANEDLRSKMLNINGYYAFNYRKFSFPAAFAQSYIQLKSAGSFLLGLSYLGGEIKTQNELSDEVKDYRVYTGHFALGAGYGYNFVLPHRWMLHVSALPTVVVFNRNNIKLNGEKYKSPFYFPDFIFTERMALVHYFTSNFFMRYTAILTNSVIGKPDKQLMVYNKWRAVAMLGWRI